MRNKGQTTLVMIVIVIIVFSGVILFLLSLAETVSQEEYMNLYAHNMLLSVLRTDTGYLDSSCQTVADTISCAFLEPSRVCEGSGMTCRDLAGSLLEGHASRLEETRKNYLYLFTVEPTGGLVVRDPETGEPMVMEVGTLDPSAKGDVMTANERIVKGGNILKVQLRLAKR